MSLEIVLTFLVVITGLLYVWLKHVFSYWKRQNVKFIEPLLLFGNLRKVVTIKQCFGHALWDIYKTKGFEDEPVIGFYNLQRPALLVRDVELIKRIMITDFSKFPNRVLTADPYHDPLGSKNIFFARMPKWRILRQKLSPFFSGSKLRQMYPLIIEIAKDLESHLAKISSGSVWEVRQFCQRYTTDAIASVAFGMRSNSLQDPDAEFYKCNLSIFDLGLRRAIDIACLFAAPRIGLLLRMKVFTEMSTRFFYRVIKEVLEERERTGAKRNDLIDALMGLRKEETLDKLRTKDDPRESLDFIVAQAATFQAAGFESSSVTMMYVLYELALNPDIQERVRAEILEALESEGGDCVSFEKIQELTYLGQVVNETLRKYPAIGFLERESIEDVDLNISGYPIIKAGTAFYVSIVGIHRDEKYWPDPERFDPERFSAEKQSSIDWNTFLPFGIGARNCVGMRLGSIQTKVGLLHILKGHRVLTCESTPKTIEFNPKGFTLTPTGALNLKLERVENY